MMYNIDGEDIAFFGNPEASNTKFNKVAKIAKRYDEITTDMMKIVNNNWDIPTSKDFNCAVAVLVIMKTGVRIGNEDSAEGYFTTPHPNEDAESKFVQTYGLTTMLQKHITLIDGKVELNFLGKKHVKNTYRLPAEFNQMISYIYLSNYEPVFGITNDELTRFIEKNTSPYFSSKDFRTFRANVIAYKELMKHLPVSTKADYKKAVAATAEATASALNNTPGVVKKSYIDPQLFEHYATEIK